MIDFSAIPSTSPVSRLEIDVESAVEEMLRGAELTLRRKRPVIFLSTHTHALRNSCTSLLERWGYSVSLISSLSPIHHDLLARPIRSTVAAEAVAQ